MTGVLSTFVNTADVDSLREVPKSTVKRQRLNSNWVRDVRLQPRDLRVTSLLLIVFRQNCRNTR